MKLVSVVIPCYNQGKYLSETISSVLASTYNHFEIIIVNDGSTDGSLEIAEGFQKLYDNIKVVNQTNQGVSVARNNGIKIASGVYLLLLDGDDLISPDYLEKSIEVLDTNQRVKVVYCQAMKFSGDKSYHWKLKAFNLYNLAINNMIFISAVIRKSDVDSIGGFSEDMQYGREDWEFWIKMLKNGGEVIQLPIIGFYYRLTQGSRRKSTLSSANKKKEREYLNQKHQDLFLSQLNGPLRKMRSKSKLFNTLLRKIGLLN